MRKKVVLPLLIFSLFLNGFFFLKIIWREEGQCFCTEKEAKAVGFRKSDGCP
ncbi:MAG TPA: hypothetical protein VMX76_03160 [Nevskiaceae bacterium]|nr:hypothetical protein [Nevskiaceae bacterium]